MSAQHTPGPLKAMVIQHDGQAKVFSNYETTEGAWDDIYVNFSGYFGSYGPHMFAAAPDLLAAIEGLANILSTAESNASGNPEWEAVSKRINAARAAIAKARGETA